ncbi:hypothetical protein Ani05nite_26910 [Amorphoplanes nipponensis]|uniref:DUF4190 domain-containing protein n=1 Tax=Actinoplanes nipponensis TaxID=135950 RepID=A0A919JGN4_9ACTN|nr:hypothetical protein [Actinoplanes nipponensis]GIE49157.1 hypothetical protein Ani05nite_26910 [Actinoplanes nipponensis]
MNQPPPPDPSALRWPPYSPPPAPPSPHPPWNGKTNGFSIACLSLALLGCAGPVSITFGVIGLLQSRRNGDRRGRFYAIAGLAVCALWLLAIAVAIAVSVANPDRDAAGAARGGHVTGIDAPRAGGWAVSVPVS